MKFGQQFEFSSELLEDSIVWPNLGRKSAFERGGLSASKHGDAYVFLLICAREAFGLRRHPPFEDRVLVESLRRSSNTWEFLSDRNIENGVADIKRLWAFTRKTLFDDMYGLQRNLRVDFSSSLSGPTGYAANAMAAKLEAERNGDKYVRLEMDTLNSFTQYGNRSYGVVQIQVQVPKSDVLYLGNSIENAENGEWLVINRDPRGIVEVPVRTITCSEDMSHCLDDRKQGLTTRTPYVQLDRFRGGKFEHKRFTRLGALLDRLLYTDR